MKLQIFTVLLALAASSNAHDNHRLAEKRQTISSSATETAATSTTTSVTTATSAATSIAGSITTTATDSTTTSSTPTSATWGTSYPPMSEISLGMPSGVTEAVTTTYAAGASPTYYSGAEPLPTPFVFISADWPAQDKLPDTTSSEVQEWMKELDGWDIPDLSPTVDGTCASDPENAANAAARGWWTCGGTTRATDVTNCPNSGTWGLSFDDGPAPYTTKLLAYLEKLLIKATFFVVGSRCIERPNVLRDEYMSGHEISVHTWSHPHLTTLTNEQIVAELGWTRLAIKTILGMTPVTMRPPYGDIDDRVRAISLAMGLVPIIWTRSPSGVSFDTFDWEIPGGEVTSEQSFTQFNNLLTNASQMDTGFVVLQHDLFEQTVDMAVGYTLPAALNYNPPFTLEPIGQCNSIPYTNMYVESNLNSSFPVINGTSDGGIDTNGDGTGDAKSKVSNNSTSSGSAAKFNAASPQLASSLGAFSLVALTIFIGALW
ncbi:glycoside hydrolase/deacetylase [Gymnopus androsaceus JB14]|uniref:chitin deacetylase n=1 Tax=Gymnopus androsaceus JB14 TaxID=1447944 RepID=A0A6A4HKD3_9AGAR|nr:glycoside hydrolase/deacetylase [Gymnopus androsaceus JB14]